MEWLKNLWKNIKKTVKKIYEDFMNWIFTRIIDLYEDEINEMINYYYVDIYVIYVMFYVENGQTKMETWEQNSKHSKVKAWNTVPPGITKPLYREQADVYSATR